MPQALSAITTVMDTIDALQARQEITCPEDLEDRVRAIYRNQGLPVEEAVLKQAVALYVAAASPDLPVAPALQIKPSPSPSEVKVAPSTAADPHPGGGLSLVEVMLAIGLTLVLGTTSLSLISSQKGKAAQTEVTSALLQATHQSPVEVNHLLQGDLKGRLEEAGIEVQVKPDPPHGPWALHPTLQVTHADPAFVARLSQAALQTQTPLVVNGQTVHSVSEALAATHGTRGGNALEVGGGAP